MPQMAPMNWLTLFIFFVLVFMLFNTINYFSFLYDPQTTASIKNKKKIINWKW
uniref:ATP synthase complex subunit 8 n=1 Tax=Staphylinoidea sp. 14 KM-2017 TaxID=2219454 RepID=A0A346RJ26_9COLE|nr:ATP synthase F0 subunit 8 [Staphylinoidea sp. 14 KM-2017]